MRKLHSEDDDYSYSKDDIKTLQDKIGMYYKRVRHLQKLIRQQLDNEVEECPICKMEKWVTFVCPKCEE